MSIYICRYIKIFIVRIDSHRLEANHPKRSNKMNHQLDTKGCWWCRFILKAGLLETQEDSVLQFKVKGNSQFPRWKAVRQKKFSYSGKDQPFLFYWGFSVCLRSTPIQESNLLYLVYRFICQSHSNTSSQKHYPDWYLTI